MVDMRRLGDPLRWLERGKFLGGCATVEREGETFVVVSALPAAESVSGRHTVSALHSLGDSTGSSTGKSLASFVRWSDDIGVELGSQPLGSAAGKERARVKPQPGNITT
jgi:hypothetical protein